MDAELERLGVKLLETLHLSVQSASGYPQVVFRSAHWSRALHHDSTRPDGSHSLLDPAPTSGPALALSDAVPSCGSTSDTRSAWHVLARFARNASTPSRKQFACS